MSQAGPIDVVGGNPDIPTEFIADIGSSVPIANQLEVLGTTQAAASSPLHTIASGNTLTIIAQRSQAIVSSDATKVGLAAFDSADFTVDANGFVSFSGTGGAETLTGNTGGAISPVANNINTIGAGSITIAGAGNTLTTQLTGLTNHAVLVGAGTTTITKVGPTATAGQVLQSAGAAADPAFSTATYPSTTTINQILYSSATNVVSGLATANRGVLTTGATGVPVITALATDGQVIIGSTAGAPAAATLTAGPGISITNGSNSISIAVNGASVGQTITGNTGGAISPSSGNWNTLGAGSITISGASSTLTTQLTGLTNHAIQIGAGTSTLTQLGAGTTGQILQTNTTADPTWSTATYPSTATGTGTLLRADGTNWVATTSTYPNTNAVNTLLYASSANVMAALPTANSGILATNGSGVPSITTASGNWLNTTRTAFLAYNSADDTNATGAGTTFTVIFDTEVFDQGNNFDGTSTFTAPVTGRYNLSATIRFEVLTAAMTFSQIEIVTSNRSYRSGEVSIGPSRTSTNEYNISINTLVDMDASDTAQVAVAISNGAGNTATVSGSSGTLTSYFSGLLEC